jgi:ribosomal protein S18 acetylase RimI-like enzyme
MDTLSILNDVLVGLVGGLIVGVANYAYKYLQNKSIERKYPLSGEYITSYDDIEDGKSIRTTTPATLKQKGRNIDGETKFGGQDWKLSGTLTKEGYFSGVYSAVSPWDHGNGNFFLTIGSDKIMRGMWSGYDSKNDQVSSGKYKFVPKISNLEIVQATKDEISDIYKISEEQLGYNYLANESIENMIASDKYIVLVGKIKQYTVGFIVIKILDYGELLKEVRYDKAKIPKPFVNNAIGVIDLVAVLSTFQSKGIGYLLVKEGVKKARGSSDIRNFTSIAWKPTAKSNLGAILNLNGIKYKFEVKNYWTEDSKTKHYECPKCGNPCICSADIHFGVV